MPAWFQFGKTFKTTDGTIRRWVTPKDISGNASPLDTALPFPTRYASFIPEQSRRSLIDYDYIVIFMKRLSCKITYSYHHPESTCVLIDDIWNQGNVATSIHLQGTADARRNLLVPGGYLIPLSLAVLNDKKRNMRGTNTARPVPRQ